MKKLLMTLAVAAVTVVALVGCSTSPSIEVADDTVIVDVRTSSEYAAGHLEGAINVDVKGANFDARISELPLDGEYVIYCASGNRSASAVSRMTDLGFTDLVDAGGIAAASASTGIAIVTQ